MRYFRNLLLPVVLGGALLVFQFFLARSSVRISDSGFHHLLMFRIDQLSAELENGFYCYRSQVQQYVPKDELFYLLNPLQGAGPDFAGSLDTLMSRSVEDGYEFNKYAFGTATRINLRMDFEFLPLDPSRRPETLNAYEQYAYHLYTNCVYSPMGQRLVDTLFLDSLVTKHIRSISPSGICNYKLYSEDELVHSHGSFPAAGQTTTERFEVYESSMLPNMQLELFFEQSFWKLLADQKYFYIAILALSGLIIVLFIRNIQSLMRWKQVNRVKSEFIHLMTHEFNTPLTNLQLAVDRFQPEMELGQLNTTMSIIKMETERIRRNIQTLFEINKLTANELELRCEEVDVHKMLSQIRELYEMPSHNKPVLITTELKAGRYMLQGDARHLINVFSNLVDNSIKYSNGSPTIGISTSDAGNFIEIRFKDRGIGMTRAQSKQAFEKNYRSDDLFVQSNEGMGLGLYYSRKIVELHGGSIRISSVKGQGTEVIIQLPATQ